MVRSNNQQVQFASVKIENFVTTLLMRCMPSLLQHLTKKGKNEIKFEITARHIGPSVGILPVLQILLPSPH